MKLLSMSIKNVANKEVRFLEFKTKGISYICCDRDHPVNAIGKSIALMFINYVLTANRLKADIDTLSPRLFGYSLDSKVEYKGENYDIRVEMKDKGNEYQINGKKYSEVEYKKFFDIEQKTNNKSRGFESELLQQLISSGKDGYLKYLKSLDFLIEDFALYAIHQETIQVVDLLKETEKVLENSNKQGFIALTKYQIKDEKFEESVLMNSSVVLNENQYLLGVRF